MVSKNKIPLSRQRRWISGDLKFQKFFEAIFLLSIAIVFFWHAPLEILNTEPATGGDTGSHYWPLVTLVKEALPHWSVRVWNPGNLGGEPHLTHYFPLPYLIMAVLSLFLPLGQAFNIGTILPVLAYPFCIYVGLKKSGLKRPAPLLGVAVAMLFLYNESFSMWGGNALSTLAGQFAHLYAFCFFSLGLGLLFASLEKMELSYGASFCFAAVLLSHFYVALFIPVLFLGCVLGARENKKTLFFIFLKTGLLSFLLSAWFVIPMLHNAPWTTPFGLKWMSKNIFLEAFPASTWLALILFFSALIFLVARYRQSLIDRHSKFVWPGLVFLSLCCLLFYFIFPIFGLVDIRIFPMLYFTLSWLIPSFCLSWFRQVWSVPLRHISLLLMSCLIFWWSAQQIKNFPGWMRWNYSGWSAKPSYKDLQSLSAELKGNFSQGRVLYENSELSNSAGTMRVFEMLPYFAGRATWESVYMQATLLAPSAFYMQALISKTPSCPFPNFACTSYDPQQMLKYSRLMGISDYILINEEVIKKAEETSFMKGQKQYGIWHWFKNSEPVSLVDVPNLEPKIVPMKNFKEIFFDWFVNYQDGDPYLMVDTDEKPQINTEGKKCHPQLTVNFNKMLLHTDCPGFLHILKFAYHPTFRATNGEKFYLLSPGFLGIVPRAQELGIEWGQHWLWTFADAMSWLSLAAALILYMKKRKGL